MLGLVLERLDDEPKDGPVALPQVMGQQDDIDNCTPCILFDDSLKNLLLLFMRFDLIWER
jgi:hypothetical protein